MDIGVSIKASSYTILKIIFVVVMGFCAAKWGGFNSVVRSGFSRVIYTFFMPALCLYQTAISIDKLDDLKELWVLPAACFIHQIFQFLIAIISGYLLFLPRLERRVYVFSTSFSNVMLIPLGIVESITDETDIFGEDAGTIGMSYVCAYQLVFVITFYVIGCSYLNLNSDDPSEKDVEMIDNDQVNNEVDSNVVVAETPEPGDVQIEIQSTKSINEHNELNEPQTEQHSSEATHLKKFFKTLAIPFVFVWSKLPSTVQFILKSLFSIPTMAALFGLFFMLIKPIRDPLFVEGNWSIIGRCIKYLGGPTVVCMLFGLGGNLSKGPLGSKIKTWKIFIGLLIRFVIFPVICFVGTYYLYKEEILPQNKMIYFILQIEAWGPPALNSGVVVSVCYPEGVKTSTTILFWGYLLSIFTLTVSIVATMQTL
ncbi:Auxin efflux carrier family protein [Entamoeba marina]